jgi:inner membrane protein
MPMHWALCGVYPTKVFAALPAIAVNLIFYNNEKINSRSWWALFLFFFLATASHPILDAMTSGGPGVAFFSPFNNTRYFFPFRPIKVSPIGVAAFFSEWGWQLIKSEMLWVGIPSLLLIAPAAALRRLFDR